MTLRVGIIGAGWYGCHIGLSLKALGFDVKIYDRNSRALHDASGNNQFRLHLGFHYARHHGTRIQSRDGFMRFMERYPGLSREVPENIYAVPRFDSLIDFPTYRLIMTSSGLDYQETKDNYIGLRGVDGIMLTPERVLLISKARKYFTEKLEDNLIFNTEVRNVESGASRVVVDGEVFDFLVDCTWGHRGNLPIAFFYEPTLLLYYECNSKFPAVTFVDGPLGSLYPTEDPNIYTLSSVPHTPLGRCDNSAAARGMLASVTQETINEKRRLMEEQITRYLPAFQDAMRYLGPQFAIKTKPVGNVDDRSCYVFRAGRVLTVMSGKIDTIFHAQERVLNFIEAGLTETAAGGESSLREDIMFQVAGKI